MNKYSRSLLLLLSIVIYLAGGRALFAQAVSLKDMQNQPDVVEVTPYVENSTVKAGDKTRVALQLVIAPKYHVQSHTPTESWMIPTEISFDAPKGITVSGIRYPKPVMKEFSFGDKPKKYSILGDDPVIFADVKVASGVKLGAVEIPFTLSYQACDDKQCLPPDEQAGVIGLEVGDITTSASTALVFAETDQSANPQPLQDNYFQDIVQKRGWFLLLVAVFIGGLGLSLTPCVFPLIPVTLGYFRNQAGNSRRQTVILAVTYVAGLATTYSVLGVFAATSGALFGSWLAHPAVLIAFAIIIAAMAFSMFGYYEIRPPAFLASKSGAKAGIAGAFIMGLLFGVVAAPCTGPATIALLAFVAAAGKPLMGFLLFFILAIGIATPLLLLAIFSGNLPKSGAWMDWVKKLMGAAMLLVAVWMINPIIGIDTALKIMGVLGLALAIWLSLMEKSGFKPATLAAAKGVTLVIGAMVAVYLLLPRPEKPGIETTAYTDKAVTEAKAEGKPVMIKFSADWCIPCRELEEGAFKDPAAVKKSEQFVRLLADVTKSNSSEAKRLTGKYGVTGVPAIIFLDSQGEEVAKARIMSNVSGSELVESMEMALD